MAPVRALLRILGVSGAKKVIFNMVLMFTRRQMMAFDDLPSARKWLAARA